MLYGRDQQIGITKKDLKEALKEALKGVARAKDVNDLAGDLVRIEKRVEAIAEKLGEHDKTLERIVTILEELSKRGYYHRPKIYDAPGEAVSQQVRPREKV